MSVYLSVSQGNVVWRALINAIKKVHYWLNVFAVYISFRRVGYELPTPAAIWAITLQLSTYQPLSPENPDLPNLFAL